MTHHHPSAGPGHHELSSNDGPSTFSDLMERVLASADRFGHRQHVHLTWLAVRRYGTVEATNLISSGIQRTARYAGARRGPERAACLSLWLHAAIWCWYLDTHPTGRTWIPHPWYRHKRTPSFLDALAALRRVLWAQRITSMSAPGPDHPEITEALLDTLAYAA